MSLPGITGMHGLVGASAALPAGGFDPTSLFSGTVGGWWDPSDLSTMFKDTAGTTPVTADGDAVARINDKSGNGNHLLQSTLGNRPIFKNVSGVRYLSFDGTDDYMLVTIGSMGSSWTRINGVQSTGANLLKCFFGGTSTDDHRCQDDGSAGTIMMPNGSTVGPGATRTNSVDYVWTELWNAAPCKFAQDNAAYVTSPSVASVTPSGITVAARAAISAFAAMRWHGGLMINRTLNSTEIANCRSFFGAKQGRTL
jgi:hypothetical protein